MLELYHHGSSACAAKVRLVLQEKRLEWKGHYIDILKGEQFTPEYLAINPKGVVPVLKHEQHVIPESTVITEYLEDAFPDPALYPDMPYDRARCRLWTKAVDEELHPACSALTYVVSHRHTILRNNPGSFDDFLAAGKSEGKAARTLKWQWIQQGLEAPGAADKINLYDDYLLKMEKQLAQNTWLCGEQYTVADLVMTPYVNRLHALDLDVMWTDGRRPKVESWFSRVRQRDSFRPAMEHYMPAELTTEMKQNGRLSLPDIKKLLDIS